MADTEPFCNGFYGDRYDMGDPYGPPYGNTMNLGMSQGYAAMTRSGPYTHSGTYYAPTPEMRNQLEYAGISAKVDRLAPCPQRYEPKSYAVPRKSLDDRLDYAYDHYPEPLAHVRARPAHVESMVSAGEDAYVPSSHVTLSPMHIDTQLLFMVFVFIVVVFICISFSRSLADLHSQVAALTTRLVPV